MLSGMQNDHSMADTLVDVVDVFKWSLYNKIVLMVMWTNRRNDDPWI